MEGTTEETLNNIPVSLMSSHPRAELVTLGGKSVPHSGHLKSFGRTFWRNQGLNNNSCAMRSIKLDLPWFPAMNPKGGCSKLRNTSSTMGLRMTPSFKLQVFTWPRQLLGGLEDSGTTNYCPHGRSWWYKRSARSLTTKLAQTVPIKIGELTIPGLTQELRPA